MPRDWQIADRSEIPAELAEAVAGPPLLARLLAQRGQDDPASARAFLDPALYVPASPFEMPDMDRAVSLLREAIAQARRVRVWGDFDADGQTSTAVLYEALTAAGALADYALPTRDEGHGLHQRAIDEALRDGVRLLITCDTGITEGDIGAYGISQGLTVIITDHHDLPDELPPAHAVINPKRLAPEHALRELSGVGVAYMVARALLEDGPHATLLDELTDLAALGLVADVATQVKDVRYLIQRGLAALRRTKRLGVRALVAAAGLELADIDEDTIGFQLGPRLNAAGRLADAELAVRLLLSRDQATATALAEQLESLNRVRQGRTEAVQTQVEEVLRRNPDLARKPAIIIDGENWELGVLGLVAGEMARRYNRPAILVAHRPGEPSAASARSVAGVDIHEAIASQRALLLREGGHPMAAGFSIEPANLPAFRQGLWDWLARVAPAREAEEPLIVDARIPAAEITPALAREIGRLAPFGPGNPKPILATLAGTLVRAEDLSRKRETPHRRLHLASELGPPLRLTWFNAGELPEPGETLEAAFHLTMRNWRGTSRMELELVDWRPAEPALHEQTAALVEGRDVFDWRSRADSVTLAAQLRERYGARIVLWGEGLATPVEYARSRAELVGQRAQVLALLTAPPGPQELNWLLAEVQPQELYLLPPLPTSEPSPDEFVAQVAGMLRVALRAYSGRIDSLRMAARIGQRQSAVIAALRGLEAHGMVSLRYDAQGLYAEPADPQARPSAPADEGNGSNGESLDEQQTATLREHVQEQARAALTYLLRETRAYRQAYACDPLAALLRSQGK